MVLGGFDDLPDVDAHRLVDDLELADEADLDRAKESSVNLTASATSSELTGTVLAATAS